jgi:hypothetical protein
MAACYAGPMPQRPDPPGTTSGSAIFLPQTPLVLAARDAMAPVLPPALFGHSLRTFLYARAWAQSERLAFDEEGLLVASLFHDAGLCAPYKDTRRAFQFNSRDALHDLLAGRGVAPARIQRLTSAVLHHFQPVPRWRYGPEAGLLHIGAYLDAVGLRARRIGAARRAIRAHYPPGTSSRTLFGLIVRSIRGPRSCIGIVLPELFDDRSPVIDTRAGRGDH